MTTPVDIIHLALKITGATGSGQASGAEETNDAFMLLNMILSEWQVNRWLVYDLVEAYHASSGALSYTVGPGMDFPFADQRPDKLDAVFARVIATGIDTYLYPFMSREGFARVSAKATQGAPESFYYDPGMGASGTLFLHPVPSTAYALYAQAKASLGQFADLTTPITLPRPYITALTWNLAQQLNALFKFDHDPVIDARAAATLQAIGGSVAQVPQAVQPRPSNRAGIFSGMAMGGPPHDAR